METKIFTIIFKILILIFGIISIFLGFERIEISGTTTNPVDTINLNYYFGVTSFPTRFVGSGYGITYNNVVYLLFIITFIIGFILNFGYFKKKESSRLRINFALISIILLGIGLVGSIFSPILTMLIIEFPPTEITSFSFKLHLLIGFYMAIIVIVLVLAEYIISEKTTLINRKIV